MLAQGAIQGGQRPAQGCTGARQQRGIGGEGWEGAPGKQPRQPAACRAHAAISRPPGATAQPPHPLRRHGGAPGARSVRDRSKRRAPLHEALLLPRRPPPPPPQQQQQRRRASRGGHPAAGPACTTAAEGRRRLGPGWAARAAWWRRQPAGTTSRRGSGVGEGDLRATAYQRSARDECLSHCRTRHALLMTRLASWRWAAGTRLRNRPLPPPHACRRCCRPRRLNARGATVRSRGAAWHPCGSV